MVASSIVRKQTTVIIVKGNFRKLFKDRGLVYSFKVGTPFVVKAFSPSFNKHILKVYAPSARLPPPFHEKM
jgi:hypothetical protein